jgi:Domain of unknown function (DUF1707)/Cell wall-active antibiotics response 4TMS YvqF
VDEDSTRASDDERERAALELREHLVAGRLTLEEFSQRVELAYRARTVSDLADTSSALPAVSGGRRKLRPVRATIGFFAHIVRRGRLRLGRRGAVVSGFADVDLDLREAEIAGLETDVYLFVLFGNVDIYIPEHIGVDVTGITVFGHRRQWGGEAAGTDAPVVRVRVIALFGTVDVWHVPGDLRGSYSEIIRALRAQQRELPR